MFEVVSETQLGVIETFIEEWIFAIAMAFFAFELVRYALKKKLSWNLAADSLANFVTQIAFLGITYILLAGFYIAIYFWAAQFALFSIEINLATIAICIVLADLAYYWEHRFLHRVNAAWATHTVHHSSPHYNISVAVRFGPMDGVWPVFFHLPLVFLGFNPFLVFFSEILVQQYQTFLHTEAVKRFPKPVEAVMNTPSHHRVHHGSNDQYLDKNYAGVFIIWDCMFGTFAKEEETVRYGLVEPINSVNPIIVFFHGFWRLGRNLGYSRSPREVWNGLFGTPEWQPKRATKKQVAS